MQETVSDEARRDRAWASSFHRRGAAYRKERLVIFKEDRVGGIQNTVQARVLTRI